MTHIKRDGRYLCRNESMWTSKYGWISWGDALKLTKLNNVCPDCKKVFYERLNQTLTVV